MQHEAAVRDGKAVTRAEGCAGDEGGSRRSRRRFLGRTAAATAAAGLVLAAPVDAEAATAALPQLYPGQNRSIFQTILSDENSHANFLIGLLGAASRPK